VPETSTLDRFRTQFMEYNLWDRLLAEINRQFESKNILMTQGSINIIDETPIEAAQPGPGTGADCQPKRDLDAGLAC